MDDPEQRPEMSKKGKLVILLIFIAPILLTCIMAIVLLIAAMPAKTPLP
jgi:hypothetical protein